MRFLFVTGTTGSGKTTFIKQFKTGQNRMVPVFSTGETMRSKYGIDYFNKKGGFAPGELNTEIESLIDGFIETNFKNINGHSIAGVIEGFPRTAEQVDFLVDYYEKGIFIDVVFILSSYEKRTIRLLKRDCSDKDAKKNYAAFSTNLIRMEDDEIIITKTKNRCLDLGIPILVFYQDD